MVRLDKIMQKMQECYKEDEARFFVEATGSTLDEAINSAAIQLGVKPNFIEYEVMQKGKSGFFAIIPRDWKIIAYKDQKAKTVQNESADVSEVNTQSQDSIKQENIDGKAFVCCFPNGVFLKVIEPVGTGRAIKIDDVIEKFKKRNIAVPDENVLMPIVKDATGEYKRVANYNHNPVNDAIITVNVKDDEMSAYIYVIPPGPGGADVSTEKIKYFLQNNNVTFGFDEKRAREFQDTPVYKTEYLIAEGVRAKNGNDAHMEYFFETDTSNVNLTEDKTGQINFRDLNLIQNVVEGQPLARKTPAQRGGAGTTVTGHYIQAENGKDIQIPFGENTKLADDGLTVISTINGHVSIFKGKITVEPIFNVQGDVSLKTGNIEFLGSVMVSGNVHDGFSIIASGNIEVKGTVGNCALEAEGDIIIGQGVIGKEEGVIRAGKSVLAKFIQSEKEIRAGENVIVTDGILNSHVMAKKKIYCNGRRADVIGGTLSATEAIIARNIGSPTAGNDTVLSVGFDPQTKLRVTELNEFLENNKKLLNEVNLNLKTLQEQKKRPGVKVDEEVLQKNLTKKFTLEAEISEMESELERLKAYLDSIKTEGRVSASGNVYEGVTINIKDFTEVVRTDCKATTFYLDGGLIRYRKYKREEKVGGPSGYSTD